VSWLPARRRRSGGGQRLVVTDPASELDYKNLALLLEGLTPTGRLRPRRETGLKPRLQVGEGGCVCVRWEVGGYEMVH
jgi:ribosomal protein S18